MKLFRSPFIFSILILFNLLIFIRLRFFLPQMAGPSQLLDLETYYRLVEGVLMGINPYTVSYMQTLGPPTVLFYFLPFSFFSLPTAKFLFTIINIICGFATCHMLAINLSSQEKSVNVDSRLPPSFRNFGRASRGNGGRNSHPKFINPSVLSNYRNIWFLILTLLFFSSFPVRFSIEMGQPNLVIGYLVSLLICSVTSKNNSAVPRFYSGLLNNSYGKQVPYILASIVILKTNYLITLISLLKNNSKLTAKTLIIILGTVVLMLPVVKLSFYTFYLLNKTGNFIPQISNNQQLNYYNQSIPARLNVLGLEHTALLFYVVLALIILWIVYNSGNIMLGIIASIILSPVSWQHYYAVLFPVFIFTFVNTKNIRYRILLLIAYLLFWIEFPFLHNTGVNLFTALISSHYLISAIILFTLIFKQKIPTSSVSK